MEYVFYIPTTYYKKTAIIYICIIDISDDDKNRKFNII